MVAGYEDFDSDDDQPNQIVAVAADVDVSSDDDAGPVIAADEDIDSDSEPEPPKKPTVEKTKKPLVVAETPVIDWGKTELEKTPPSAKKAQKTPPPKKAEKRPPVAMAIESSSDEDAGPVVAPLSGDDSEDEPVVEIAPIDPGPTLGDNLTANASFMDQWLDGGDLPTSVSCSVLPWTNKQ